MQGGRCTVQHCRGAQGALQGPLQGACSKSCTTHWKALRQDSIELSFSAASSATKYLQQQQASSCQQPDAPSNLQR